MSMDINLSLKGIHDYGGHKYSMLMMKATEPLKQLLDIPYFAYQKVNSTGEYFVICNHPEYHDFYFENEFYKYDPFLVSPNRYNDGTSIHVLSSKSPHTLDDGAAKIFDKFAKKFNFTDSIIFIIKSHDSYEIFVFAFQDNDDQLLKNYLGQIDLLEKFITYFKKQHQKLLEDLNKVKVNIASIRGDNFNLERPNYDLINPDTRNAFLQTYSPEEYMLRARMKDLTNREAECLSWMIEGKTAGETAEILGISRRTVEVYREKCRDKLGSHYTFTNLCYLIGKFRLL